MTQAQPSPMAGKTLATAQLIDPDAVVASYFSVVPDTRIAAQRIRFGTSGHRGSAQLGSFNERHVLAIAQSVCLYRQQHGISGPLFLGIDTHVLSRPAFETATEVFAANGVLTMIDYADGFTPTPAISHAIIAHNKGRTTGLADGVVITPSHNPPADGGFKYNPPNGGPADTVVTDWIETRANELLETGLADVKRMPFARAMLSDNLRRFDFTGTYVNDLGAVIDLAAIAGSGLRLGIDPLGGASIGYWAAIADRYNLAGLTIVNTQIDPQFAFMTADWDGQIRMDCSSHHAMASLIAMRDRFDLAIGNDPDADRHGIVTSAGLMPPNQYLSAAIDYLFAHRPDWRATCAVGKTMVSSAMIDRVARRRGHPLIEVPVGFKYFVDGLVDGSLAFAGEESAGATLLRRDGTAWTTDKDGMVLGLLAAEMTARTGDNPATRYGILANELGETFYARTDVAATPAQMETLRKVSAELLDVSTIGGDPIETISTTSPAGGHALGGLKIATAGGWFAARPSGTEAIYKIYAESFNNISHLQALQSDAQAIVDGLI